MLYSMTGYGEAAHEDESLRVGFRVKTVNNRGLDVSLKLPFDLMYLEPALRKIAAQKLRRGRVDVFTEIELRDPAIAPPCVLNRARAAQLQGLADELRRDYHAAGELDVNTLIRLQDLTLTHRVGFRLPEAMERAVQETFALALDRVAESRALEGEKLLADFLERIAAARREVGGLEETAERRQDELREAILKRVRDMTIDASLDETRLAQEIVYHADRLDITEEITRLKAHQDTTETLLRSDKRPLGKELDFMMQEQLREVSTIGNKARHKWIADRVVKLKTGYEKMREQVQNIE